MFQPLSGIVNELQKYNSTLHINVHRYTIMFAVLDYLMANLALPDHFFILGRDWKAEGSGDIVSIECMVQRHISFITGVELLSDDLLICVPVILTITEDRAWLKESVNLQQSARPRKCSRKCADTVRLCQQTVFPFSEKSGLAINARLLLTY